MGAAHFRALGYRPAKFLAFERDIFNRAPERAGRSCREALGKRNCCMNISSSITALVGRLPETEDLRVITDRDVQFVIARLEKERIPVGAELGVCVTITDLANLGLDITNFHRGIRRPARSVRSHSGVASNVPLATGAAHRGCRDPRARGEAPGEDRGCPIPAKRAAGGRARQGAPAGGC